MLGHNKERPTAKPISFPADQTSLVSDSVVPLDSSSSSGLDTAGSSQGALAGTQALGSVTRAAADSPAQEATSARDVAAAPAAGEADDVPMYTLGSDDEDDLAVVSNVEQAREAQVGNVATALLCSRQCDLYDKGSTATRPSFLLYHMLKFGAEVVSYVML